MKKFEILNALISMNMYFDLFIIEILIKKEIKKKCNVYLI